MKSHLLNQFYTDIVNKKTQTEKWRDIFISCPPKPIAATSLNFSSTPAAGTAVGAGESRSANTRSAYIPGKPAWRLRDWGGFPGPPFALPGTHCACVHFTRCHVDLCGSLAFPSGIVTLERLFHAPPAWKVHGRTVRARPGDLSFPASFCSRAGCSWVAF